MALSSARSQPAGHAARGWPSSGTTCAHQGARLVGVVQQDPYHRLDRDVVVVGMPAIEVGHHRHGRVADSASRASLASGMLVMPITLQPQER